MQTAPVVLFTYNRLQHTKRTINALRLNSLAATSDLIIYSDGPRSPRGTTNVDSVRDYLREIEGFRSVKIVTRPQNLGLARSIIEGVNEVLNVYDRVIVLEDDMETSTHFLEFMNSSLELYATDTEVASIHGYVYPVNESLPETFFLRGADCWGWATWKRAWDTFELDGQRSLDQLQARELVSEFNFGGAADFTEMLDRQIRGKNNSWAIRWHASAFLKGMLTLYPGRALVRNIGSDSSGNHCGSTDAFDVGDVSENRIHVAAIPLCENADAKSAFAAYFLRIKRKKMLIPIAHLLATVTKYGQFVLRATKKIMRIGADSTGYTILSGPPNTLSTVGWEDSTVALRQHESFMRLLSRMAGGRPRKDFIALANSVDATGMTKTSLLEIGCGSGWNSAVIRSLSKCSLDYTGVDCSPPMLDLARATFPNGKYFVGDALSVQAADLSFDIVVSGTVLMHLPDYLAAVQETARLSSKWCIFHTVPVLQKRSTTFMMKRAYGGQTMEVVFNEEHLLSVFRSCGMTVRRTFSSLEYNLKSVLGETTKTKTYLCEKNS